MALAVDVTDAHAVLDTESVARALENALPVPPPVLALASALQVGVKIIVADVFALCVVVASPDVDGLVRPVPLTAALADEGGERTADTLAPVDALSATDAVAHVDELTVVQPDTDADASGLLVIERMSLAVAQPVCVAHAVTARLAVARALSLETPDCDAAPLADAVVDAEGELLGAPDIVPDVDAHTVFDTVPDGVVDAHTLPVLDAQKLPTGDALADGVCDGERDCELHVLGDVESAGDHETGVPLPVREGVAHCDALDDALGENVGVSVDDLENVPDTENVGDAEADAECDAALVALAVAPPSAPAPVDCDGVALEDAAGVRDGVAGAESVGVDAGDVVAPALLDAHCDTRPLAVEHALGDAERLLEFVARAGVLEARVVVVVEALADSDEEKVVVEDAAPEVVAALLRERAALGDCDCRPDGEPSREVDAGSDADTVTDVVATPDRVNVAAALALPVAHAVGGAREKESGDVSVALIAALAVRVATFVNDEDGDADAQTDAVEEDDALAPSNDAEPHAVDEPVDVVVSLPHDVAVALSDADVEMVDDAVTTSLCETVHDKSGVGDTDAAPRIDALAAFDPLLVTLARAVDDAHALTLALTLPHRLTTPLLVSVTVEHGDDVAHAVAVTSAVALAHDEALDVVVELIEPLADSVSVAQGVTDADASATDADAHVDAVGVRLPATLMLAVAQGLPKSLPVALADTLAAVDRDWVSVEETDVELESVALTVPLTEIVAVAQRDGDAVEHPDAEADTAAEPVGLGVPVDDALAVELDERVAVAQAELLLVTLAQPDGVRVAHSVDDALGLPLALRVTPPSRPPVALIVTDAVREMSALPLTLAAELALAHALEQHVALGIALAESV